jgi:hypothetical protein
MPWAGRRRPIGGARFFDILKLRRVLRREARGVRPGRGKVVPGRPGEAKRDGWIGGCVNAGRRSSQVESGALVSR